MRIILASTSPYRRKLMSRLRLPFEAVAPDTDESLLNGEAARDRACRLARLKAESVAANTASESTVIIGSDQVASLRDTILRKPGTPERAIDQLLKCSGATVQFWTAVSVIWPHGYQQRVIPCAVTFRALSETEAAHYVEIDDPLACAGSFKWESLGISLFQKLETQDPTSLEGLPLIALCELLREAGVDLPLAAQPLQH